MPNNPKQPPMDRRQPGDPAGAPDNSAGGVVLNVRTLLGPKPAYGWDIGAMLEEYLANERYKQQQIEAQIQADMVARSAQQRASDQAEELIVERAIEEEREKGK